MDRSVKKSVLFLFISIIFFGLSSVTNRIASPDRDVQNFISKTENKLAEIIAGYDSLIANREIIDDLIEEGLNSKYFDELLRKPYVFLIYRKNKLIFWNSNHVVPQFFLVTALDEGSNAIRLANGFYEISKSQGLYKGEEVTFFRLLLIKSNYSVENNYLKNRFNPIFELPDFVEINLNQTETSLPVNGKSGKLLFYLSINEPLVNGLPDYPRISTLIIAFIFLFLAIYFLAKYVVVGFNPWAALAFLIIVFGNVRWLMLMYDYPSEFYDLNLFNPQLYASSTINKSLGDLVINLILIFGVVYFFFRNIGFKRFKVKTPALKYGLAFLIYLGIFFFSQFIGVLFRSLLLDSKISFDFNDFLSLNHYSFIGLLCLSLALLGFLLMVIKMIRLVNEFKISKRNLLYLAFISVLIYSAYLFIENNERVNLLSAICVFGLVIFIQRVVLENYSLTSISNWMMVVFIVAVWSSLNLHHFNGINDMEKKKALARKLSIERDLVTEYLFVDIQEKIFNDLFIRNYFRQPFISTPAIVERIRTKYFTGFFSKYDVNIYTLNKEGMHIRSGSEEYLDLLSDDLVESAQQTISDYLYYIPKPSGSYAYISNLPIIYRSKLIGSVVLELVPKTYSKANLYPELLLEEMVKPPKELEKYSYGLYSNELLIKKMGGYPYKLKYSFEDSPLNKDFVEVHEADLVHLVYKADMHKRVVITGQLAGFIQPVSLFSYLFCIFLLFTLLVQIVRTILRSYQQGDFFENILSISLKDRIQFSMIFIIVFSFFIIGYVTISHFVAEYSSYHEDRLTRKKSAIISAIEYILKEDSSILTSNLNPSGRRPESPIDLVALSDINAMDINIYDLEGKIINTSQPEIFEKELLSQLIDPEAFKSLVINKKALYTQNEVIGNLMYLAIYAPIRDNLGKLVGYLNLPYFAREKEFNREISSLLVALINVYVLLLVIGGFLAYLLSDSITKSFEVISEKLKLVQLGKKNEPIEWKSKDEIGGLVAEYNKMISELEKSAGLLAKSERESAWREMAKQIAHEIKNPLTPMKLSIQHLQRAMAEGDPKAHELAKRVSATLIEQIDNLEHIANEFSSFATMPRAQNEEVILSEVIQSVVDLFGEEKNLDIEFDSSGSNHLVFADKNQLLSAFNNLVKNASQAIPDERTGKIHIKITSDDGMITTLVKDNGIGISEEQKNKVFVPNFTTKSGGTGLGLALTRQIIENAKGKIWFESEVGSGTTFFVQLPTHKGIST